MTQFRFPRQLLTISALTLAVPSLAQVTAASPPGQPGFVPQPTPIADRLAIQMRTLAANPGDLSALIAAGELSAMLDDNAAALQFLARAERIAPRDPRIAVGRGRALARLGRPGEALRRFAEAEAAGLAPAGFAADRGLAYDLLGQSRHAQVEYARALTAADDDELRRRYAVSLAIAGDRAAAEAMLDPLLRRQDRAAWRTRALVLAMTGDMGNAERVAVQMMPGFGTAYLPLFRRLSQIRDPADRAFAAHLGEFARTPARMADAGMAPALPALPAVVSRPPVALAAAAPPRAGARTTAAQPARASAFVDRQAARRAAAARSREDRRERALASRMARATAAPRVSAIGSRVALPPVALASVASRSPVSTTASVAGMGASIAAARPVTATAPARPPERVESPGPRVAALTDIISTRTTPPPPIALATSVSAPVPATVAAATRDDPAATPGFSTADKDVVPVALASAPDAASPAPATVVSAATPASSADAVIGPVATSPAPSPVAARRIGGEDDVLASIVSGIVIPANELGVAAPALASARVAEPIAPPVAAPRPAPAPVKPEVAKAEPAKPKAAAATKAATPKKKPEPAKKPPAEAARHWVQVAGGANVGDLPRAWQKLVDKAPAALKGRSAWTTPLRFTNRLLTGPFKTPAEAQGFVNTLTKAGLSGFAWTSEAGQKIDKLPAR